ncbi:MAG: hypothetical protein M3083_01490 [Actinomycetota bacterium]|nr:hypothetical protein [Actinomycetota bacterium]MDQ6946902.1 hypothetical protein [Actinomycetota bacterium]
MDQIDGPAERWRFAVGCVSAALLFPPGGRAAAPAGALVAVAATCAGLFAFAFIWYPGMVTDATTWVGPAIFLAALVGDTLAGTVLRRAGLAGSGLVGGLVVTVAWLKAGGVRPTNMILSPVARLVLLFVVPLAVGAGGTWRGRQRRRRPADALLAGVSASLSLFVRCRRDCSDRRWIAHPRGRSTRPTSAGQGT